MPRSSARHHLGAMLVGATLSLAVVACSDQGADVGTLEEQADRLEAAVDQAVDAVGEQGVLTVRHARRPGPCDPGRSSVDEPMGRSIGHSVEVSELDPDTLDDAIQRVAEAWGVEVDPANVTEDGTVVFLAEDGVTVSATSDRILGRVSVTGETRCHPDA